MKSMFKTGVVLLFLFQFTLTVSAQTTDIYAVVVSVDAPDTVAPGEAVKVQIAVEYNFPEMTQGIVGVYDPETWEAIEEMDFEDQGNFESGFELEIIAPDEEGTYELAADVLYFGEEGLTYTEGSEAYFSITVTKPAEGIIPGFPLGALLVGLGFALYSSRKQLNPINSL